MFRGCSKPDGCVLRPREGWGHHKPEGHEVVNWKMGLERRGGSEEGLVGLAPGFSK